MRSYAKAAKAAIMIGSAAFGSGVGIVVGTVAPKGFFQGTPRDFRVAAAVAGTAVAYMGANIVLGGVQILKQEGILK